MCTRKPRDVATWVIIRGPSSDWPVSLLPCYFWPGVLSRSQLIYIPGIGRGLGLLHSLCQCTVSCYEMFVALGRTLQRNGKTCRAPRKIGSDFTSLLSLDIHLRRHDVESTGDGANLHCSATRGSSFSSFYNDAPSVSRLNSFRKQDELIGKDWEGRHLDIVQEFCWMDGGIQRRSPVD
jgi:hypothetical protein